MKKSALCAVFGICLLSVVSSTPTVRAQDNGAMITQAAPERASAVPAKPRMIVVFDRCDGFRHESIPVADKAMEILGKKTGAFQTTVTDDMSLFEGDKLARFDAIVLNNTAALKFASPDHRKALLDFVKSGKGLVGIHAATDCFQNWSDGAKMIGGVFAKHPWSGGGTWAVKLDDPEHPINKAFGGKGFRVRDEIFQFKPPFSPETNHLLLSLDMADAVNQVRGAGDYPNAISWIRRYGSGRVFYCCLGHNASSFWNPVILQHYLDGIQWAIGDLMPDATPPNSVAKQSPPRFRVSEPHPLPPAWEKALFGCTWSSHQKMGGENGRTYYLNFAKASDGRHIIVHLATVFTVSSDASDIRTGSRLLIGTPTVERRDLVLKTVLVSLQHNGGPVDRCNQDVRGSGRSHLDPFGVTFHISNAGRDPNNIAGLELTYTVTPKNKEANFHQLTDFWWPTDTDLQNPNGKVTTSMRFDVMGKPNTDAPLGGLSKRDWQDIFTLGGIVVAAIALGSQDTPTSNHGAALRVGDKVANPTRWLSTWNGTIVGIDGNAYRIRMDYVNHDLLPNLPFWPKKEYTLMRNEFRCD